MPKTGSYTPAGLRGAAFPVKRGIGVLTTLGAADADVREGPDWLGGQPLMTSVVAHSVVPDRTTAAEAVIVSVLGDVSTALPTERPRRAPDGRASNRSASSSMTPGGRRCRQREPRTGPP